MKHGKYWLCILLAVLSGTAVLLICHQGIGLSSDTLSYFRFPATGNYAFLPIHHGILYPILLRQIVLLGLSVTAAATALNVFCASATAAVLFLLFAAAPFKRPLPIAALFTFLICFSLPVLMIQAYAMSESLFLLLITIGIYLFSRALCLNSTGLALASSIAFALSCLTRYAGLAFVGAACLSIMLFVQGRLRYRIWLSMAYGLFSCVPLGLILFVNKMRSGSGTDREMIFHGIPMDSIHEGASTLASFFIPDRIHIAIQPVAYIASILVILGLLAGVAIGTMKKLEEIGVYALCGVAYLAFLLFSILFFDVSIMLSHRMLSPLVVILFLLLFRFAMRFRSKANARLVLMIAGSYMLLFTAYRAFQYINRAYAEGAGYSSVAWNRSPLINLIEEIQAHHIIYSNAADAMVLRGYPDVAGIPQRQKSTSNRDLETYTAAYGAMKSNIVWNGAFLAHVGLRYWPPYLAPVQSIVDDCHMSKLISSEDGIIYSAGTNSNMNQIIEKAQQINESCGEAVFQLFPQ